MTYLNNYLKKLSLHGKIQLSEAIKKTTDDIIPRYISNFNYRSHVVGLLVGDIQSGKTSHIFGLISAAADEGFSIFVLLTTDNIILQQQTYDRAKNDLCDFCICDENDFLLFKNNNMQAPIIIILKKNSHILKQWRDNFSATNFCAGNPLFIIDDEADTASLNTMINTGKQSAINKYLEQIKKTTSSSIYLQVTGTPQAILLQTIQSGWKPYFIYYFRPGKNYLGGNFFFQELNPCIIFTDNSEAEELLVDDEFPENGLKTALIMHLITSAYILLNGGTVCNFLIHPSIRTNQHIKFAEKIGDYLNEIILASSEAQINDIFKKAYRNLKETKIDMNPFSEIFSFIHQKLANDEIKILVLNSITNYDKNIQYKSGINIIIGGNSLGRGITFPCLQTIYYCRLSKNPQADTMWQHSRMFGYDREPSLIRVFMPPILYKLFSEINMTNNSIIAQIEKENTNNIKLYYPTKLRPTRKNILDKQAVVIFSGGVNYFPFHPINKNISVLDKLLAPFENDVYSVNLKLINHILEQTGSEIDDWNVFSFIDFINIIINENPRAQGKLIVRRNRDIAKGTGTLLSPNDRNLGNLFQNDVVLTIYKITGNKGWNGKQLWIPNLKLPSDIFYYSVLVN
jgi:hypothetical protein